MPLVVLCGIPGAGKTFVAEQLVAFLERKCAEDGAKACSDAETTGSGGASGRQVVYISEDTLHIARMDGYRDGRAEKNTRSALRSAVESALTDKTIVVLDSLNYIKGSRYELFCKAKTENTTYCVVYVDVPVEIALARNGERKNQTPPEDAFEPQLVQEIAQRFEVPNGKNRWDQPLFHLTNDALTNGDLQLDAIAACLLAGQAMKAGLATQSGPVAESNFLQQLELITSAIVDTVLAHQRDGNVADGLRIAQAKAKLLHLGRTITAVEIRRHRRQFLKLSRLHPCAVDAIGDLFIAYLNEQA